MKSLRTLIGIAALLCTLSTVALADGNLGTPGAPQPEPTPSAPTTSSNEEPSPYGNLGTPGVSAQVAETTVGLTLIVLDLF